MSKNGKMSAVVSESLDLRKSEADDTALSFDQPYSADVSVVGVAPIIFHRYDCELVEKVGKSAKGASERKTDNVESYVYRVPGKDEIGVTAKVIKSSIVHAGKSLQDPRSKRKSMADLIKASIFVTPLVPSLGVKTWDYLDKSRMVVQRSAVPRVRPALQEGWKCSFTVNVIQPQLVPVKVLRQLLDYSGDFCGWCDSRPDYGRFKITSFAIRESVATR